MTKDKCIYHNQLMANRSRLPRVIHRCKNGQWVSTTMNESIPYGPERILIEPQPRTSTEFKPKRPAKKVKPSPVQTPPLPPLSAVEQSAKQFSAALEAFGEAARDVNRAAKRLTDALADRMEEKSLNLDTIHNHPGGTKHG